MVSVTVKFSESVEKEGEYLLAFEKMLRITGEDFRVFKEKMGDDSKLRIRMTPIERERL